MQVKVFGKLRSMVEGRGALAVPTDDGDTVLSALLHVMQEYPALQRKMLDDDQGLRAGLSIFLNGRSVTYLDGLDTSVRDSDILALFPPIAGG